MDMPQGQPARSGKWIAFLWLGFGLFDAVQTVFTMRAEGMHHAWVTLFFTDLFNWLPWALATALILALSRRSSAAGFSNVSGWIGHTALWSAINITYSAWAAGLQTVFNPYAYSSQLPFLTLWRCKIYDGLLSSIVLYAFVVIIGYTLDSRAHLIAQQTETARLNEQLSRAQFEALRRQIEPHFLFNTLNSVAALVRDQRNDDAIQMIVGLSDLLRRSLDSAPHHQVPLREELDFAQKYLDIQKTRFADRLTVSMDVPTDLNAAQVPSLILQPMVENAVQHGIAHRAQGGTISISASRTDRSLTLRIANDGPNLPANWESSRAGIGITNVRTRLATLYGTASAFSLSNRPNGGVEVSLSLPFVLAPES
jgi:two-component system LytT family sensor kinase